MFNIMFTIFGYCVHIVMFIIVVGYNIHSICWYCLCIIAEGAEGEAYPGGGGELDIVVLCIYFKKK